MFDYSTMDLDTKKYLSWILDLRSHIPDNSPKHIKEIRSSRTVHPTIELWHNHALLAKHLDDDLVKNPSGFYLPQDEVLQCLLADEPTFGPFNERFRTLAESRCRRKRKRAVSWFLKAKHFKKSDLYRGGIWKYNPYIKKMTPFGGI